MVPHLLSETKMVLHPYKFLHANQASTFLAVQVYWHQEYFLAVITSHNFLLQELRRLVRRVHSSQEMKDANDEDEKKVESVTIGAKKALTRFLRGLAKSIPNEY